MKCKPYEEYKKVDLPWIDEIPSHWEMERNKNFLTVKDETVGNKDKNYKLLSLTKKGIIERDMENPKGKFPSSFETYKIVEKNDIIFCLFDIDETPRTVGLSKLDGMITGAYNIFSINKINKNYYYYYYLYLDKFKMLKPLYTGLRKTINEDAFLRLRTPLPPKEEQDKIADFLDHNLAKIDKFVELTERQIELLKEQKEVIINDAVTKGIDKNVAYKDSGIDWIGEIPEHWEVTRLKYLLEKGKNNIKVGPFGSQLKNSDLTTKGKWVYNQRTVLDKNFLTNSSFISEKKYNELIGFKVEKDDILITTRGSIGRVCKIPANFQEGVIHPCIIKFRLDEKIYDYELLEIIFNESKFIRNQISILSNATTIDVIYSTTLKNIYIPLPKLSEQQQIVAYIEKEIKKIDRTIELYKNQIELIKEYRTSLIASAVTGKIDVRDF